MPRKSYEEYRVIFLPLYHVLWENPKKSITAFKNNKFRARRWLLVKALVSHMVDHRVSDLKLETHARHARICAQNPERNMEKKRIAVWQSPRG